eukprot:scaffold434_cov186-Pinguiococcus_pyrenoidosus.AAC.105
MGFLRPKKNCSAHTSRELQGIEARVDVGNKDVLENCLDPDIESFQEKHEAMAHTTIFVKVNRNEALGMALQDTLRPLAKTAMHQIVKMGIQVAILSGDLPSTVRSVADELRIGYRNAHGGFTATNKVRAPSEHWVWRATKGGTKACASSIADLEEGGDAAACFGESPSSKGKAVVFVGDGMNDTKALRAAEVGIAMGSGTGLAVDAADAVLVKDDLSVIPWAILGGWLQCKIYPRRSADGLAIVGAGIAGPPESQRCRLFRRRRPLLGHCKLASGAQRPGKISLDRLQVANRFHAEAGPSLCPQDFDSDGGAEQDVSL